MNFYARRAYAMLLGAFGFLAIAVGLEGVLWRMGVFRIAPAAKALPENVPPLAVIFIGVAALYLARRLVLHSQTQDDDD